MSDNREVDSLRRLAQLIEPLAGRLSDSSRADVNHWLDVGEAEMACESVILAIHAERPAIDQETKFALLDMAKKLHLDRESVFRGDFWQLAVETLGDHVRE